MTTQTFSPGDRIRNTVYDRDGVVVDDADNNYGTIAVRYNESSQVWYVLPRTLELVRPSGVEDAVPAAYGEDE